MLRIEHNGGWKQEGLAGLERRCLPPSPMVPFLEVCSSIYGLHRPSLLPHSLLGVDQGPVCGTL